MGCLLIYETEGFSPKTNPKINPKRRIQRLIRNASEETNARLAYASGWQLNKLPRYM